MKENKTWYRKILLLPILSFILAATACGLPKEDGVKKLQVDFMTNPIGLDNPAPRFSWIMKSGERAVSQVSYQIAVSIDEKGTSVVWDSGVVESSESDNILYSGPALQASTRYFWTVSVVNNKGSRLKSKEKAYFETGLMDSGWSGAQWIRHQYDAMPDKHSVSKNFDLEMDVTLKSDNIGIVFGAKDNRNMHMWSINTFDNEYPILRRHIYVDGSPQIQDISLKDTFSESDLLDTECHVKISVREDAIETYINDKIVDTCKDPVLNGEYIGFRTYKNENIYEHAYIDNIVLTNYKKGRNGELQSSVTFMEDFENGSNDFEREETVEVDGNTKLNVYSRNEDWWSLQSAARKSPPTFRTKFNLDKEVEYARIYSSGLGMYDLFVNGKRVGRQMEDGTTIYDELKPGWTDYSNTVFYSTYDVTALLNNGGNAIGAIVSSGWINGGISFGKYGNPELGFMAKLLVRYKDGTSEVIVTNTDSWMSSDQSPVREGDIYNGESYDARMESDWTSPEYDDSSWKRPAVNTYFDGDIKAFTGPAVQIRPELNRTPQTITIYDGIKNNGSTYGEINIIKTIGGDKTINLKKGEKAIIDFGQNIVGWIHFNVKGQSGTRLRGRFSEMLNDSGEMSRRNDNAKGTLYLENLRKARATLCYTLKGDAAGEEFRPSLSFFGFRYCEITATQDVVIEKITAEVVGSVTEEGSSLKTSDESVNQLYSNVIWGQRGNFISIPTDCPQRDERLGWTGDTQIFCRTAAYNANVASFFHKWMGDMRDSQSEDGAYPDVAPHVWFSCGQAAWADAGIIVPWVIYLMYDDKAILRENYESMEKYMEFLANQKEDGYLYNGAGTAFGDWLSYESTDKRFISVCYYAYDAQLMAKMAKALGREQDAEKYNTLYGNIKQEFQSRYVNADGSLKEKSQTAYLLALKFDLFPSETDAKNAADFLVKKIADNGYKLSTGFVGTGVLNQTLSDVGATEMAYNLLLQRNDPSWLYSVDQGATTIWERWNSYTIENGFGEATMNSFNHYAYGVIAEWMFRYMAGIDTDENNPGFKHIIICPNPDTRKDIPQGQERMTEVDATYASIQGDIRSKWKLAKNGDATYEVTVPANTTASLIVPQIKDNSYVYENNKRAEEVAGVGSVREENGKYIIDLGSGSYRFNVR